MSKIRPYISLGMFLAGSLLLVSGVCMVIGGPAKWATEPFHEAIGIAFVVLALCHMFLNFKAIKNNMVDKSKTSGLAISRAFIINSIIILLFIIYGVIYGAQNLEKKIASKQKAQNTEQKINK